MATIAEIKKEMTSLMAAYPMFKPAEGTLTHYADALKEFDTPTINAAVKSWVRKNKWFPTVSELLDLAIDESDRIWEAHYNNYKAERARKERMML